MERGLIERVSRSNVQSAYCGDHVALCRVLGKYLMYVDTRDNSLSPHMMLNGFWESWVTKAVMDHLKPGMVCVDAGASNGYFTLIMAGIVGERGHVYAFEPNPRSADLLHQTLDVNGFLGRVTLIQKGLSDSEGKSVLRSPIRHTGGGSIGALLPHLVNSEVTQSEVELTTLDNEIPGSIDFLKADIEGSELKMVHGMTECWKRSPNLTMCFEYATAFYEEKGALPDALVERGGRLRMIDGSGSLSPFNTDDAVKGDPAKLWMLWVTT